MSSKLFTVAISTYGDGVFNLLSAKFNWDKRIEYIVIHQLGGGYASQYEDAYNHLESSGNIVVIPSDTVGLSISRNLAIFHCKTQWILFSDDDNYYFNKLYETIENTIFTYPKYSFFSFKIVSDNGLDFKKYKEHSFEHTLRSILRISSIENLFNCDFLKCKKLTFDERFGLGSKYPSCEQPIFAKGILSSGGKGLYLPIAITIHPLENSGDDFYSRANAVARKKMFKIVYGNFFGHCVFAIFVFGKMKLVPQENKMDFLRSIFSDK
ncbi:glycosyltransferase [Vibrio splendidus]|uniref:glycosyltransferase n=1 Tax=Vibrio splendidus TaxID=29497 RepID=UPI00352E4ED1